MTAYAYRRRPTVAAHIGGVTVGSDSPIRLQSMTNTATLDIDASTAQCRRIADAGADIVRLTAQGVVQAKAMGQIRDALRRSGCQIPLVADIHFNPAAAFEAAVQVEKVRINPGNFYDPGRTFRKIDYTDTQYADELTRIREKFIPFLNLCRSHNTAIRIGVNHGSLSDRIMSRYGDTPAGMVESALEFLRICRDENFTDVVISIKASNVVVMTETVHLLVEAMDAEDMHFPLHLGVTEAGDGEDARIKSAAGIGSLLADGIGDTIRVSLSEAPENEIPVARMIVDHISRMQAAGSISVAGTPRKRIVKSPLIAGIDTMPANTATYNISGDNIPAEIMRVSADAPHDVPQLICVGYPTSFTPEQVIIAASVDIGWALLHGYGDIFAIEAPQLTEHQRHELLLGIFQATRIRMTKTEYIACPGCGRTLYDLQSVLHDIKQATSHLKGLKIGVMGCIVNGPGEMADADYGYVGAAAGRISLYKGKDCILKNIPQEQAITHLIQLIKDNGDWIEPECR